MINALIITTIIVCLVVLKNPLALLALLVLQQLPQGVDLRQLMEAQDQGDDEKDQPMGFNANIR